MAAPHDDSTRQAARLLTLAVTLAEAVTRERRARDRAERVADRMERLATVSASLARALSPVEVAEPVVDVGIATLGARSGGVWIRSEDARLELVHGAGYPPPMAALIRDLPLDSPMPLVEAVRRNEAVWIESRAAYAAAFPNAERSSHPVRTSEDVSFACLPLTIEGRSVGGLSFGFGEARRFDEDERRFLGILAQHCAQALERARAHQAERATRGVLDALADASPLAIVLLDLDGTVRLWNPAAERIFGWSAAEVLGRRTPVVGEHDAEDLLENLRCIGRGGSLSGLEARRATKHRGAIDVGIWAGPLTDAEGRVRCLSIVADLSDRKRDEAAIRAQAQRARVLAEASHAFAAAGLEWQAAFDTVARQLAEQIGDACVVRFVADDLAESTPIAAWHRDPEGLALLREVEAAGPLPISSFIRAALRAGEVLVVQLPADAPVELPAVWARYGARFQPRSFVVAPLRHGARAFGYLALHRDGTSPPYDHEDVVLLGDLVDRAVLTIEAARMYREAREAVAARDEFLAVASHELKTPLTSLQLQIETTARKLARAEPAPKDDLATRLRDAHQQVRRLGRLVDQLLEVSRITAGRLVLDREELDLVALAREVGQRFEHEASRAGCTIELRGDAAVVGAWDRLRVDQILTNLVANAVKYGAGAPIEIAIARAADRARICVRDHGVGIAEADRARLFQRFERLVSSRSFGGFGLGLWISRQAVEAHGGTITVESEPGRGATFVVELPSA